MKGRFAVVKLWPEIKTAEDECIARMKLAAQALGLECIEIHPDGRLLESPDQRVSKDLVDFVIHLHYETPKNYDVFSFVALWNPTRFYHEWGYSRCSRNLTTHDDFISCSSDAADHHVARMIRNAPTHLPPRFHLYHSTPDILYPPSLGDVKLFYAGINWEAINGGKSRHQEVLKRLDKTGLIRIFGPQVFQGARVWAGYDSYVREIPFDGMSIIEEISKAGVALVLSSQAHKDSALMSNRLFESVAAGALVICDENAFAKKFFGDSLLYIDGRSPVEQIVADIRQHLDWVRANPDQALTLAAKAQEIFRERFTLIRNLRDLYNSFSERREELRARQNPPSSVGIRVRLNMLMPHYSKALLQAHVDSINVQDYPLITPVLVVDSRDAELHRAEIDEVLSFSKVAIELYEIDFHAYSIHQEIKVQRRLGEILMDLLGAAGDWDAFMVLAPNERLLSNHVSVLAGALQRDPEVNCAATASILLRQDMLVRNVNELIDFEHLDKANPPGYGRFIFRRQAISDDIGIALPYLHGRPLAVLVGSHTISKQLPATILINTETEFPERIWDDASENEVIGDYCPEAFRLALGFGVRRPILEHQVPVSAPPAITLRYFARLLGNRQWLMRQFTLIFERGLVSRLQVLKQKVRL